MDIWLRVAVYGTELILTYGLISWMRSSQRGQREPWSFIFKILAFGALTAVISAFVELKYSFSVTALQQHSPALVAKYGNWYDFINNMSSSLIEELGKYMIGVFSLLSTKHVHKMSDTIVYLIIIGLGFSLVEDAIFLLNTDTAPILRLMSFYLHSGTSAIIGYSLGRFKFGLAGYRELVYAVFGAIGLHFAFNLTTNLGNSPLALYLAFFISMYITLQIFILFRRTLVEEYGLELRARRLKYTMLLNTSPVRPAKSC